MSLWRNQPSNLGKLHKDKTGILKHREWRGIADTMYDYYRWLITWKDIIVMTHHCPTGKCISEQYVGNDMNASYVSDLEEFITSHPNIRAWVCGHVHSQTITTVGAEDRNQLIVCNPRGYERNFEAEDWNPNTFIDTESWTCATEPFENKKLKAAREKAKDDFMKYAPFIF